MPRCRNHSLKVWEIVEIFRSSAFVASKNTTLEFHMKVRALETATNLVVSVYVYYLTRESRIKPIKKDPFMPNKQDKKRSKKCKLENTVKRESVKKRAKRKIAKNQVLETGGKPFPLPDSRSEEIEFPP